MRVAVTGAAGQLGTQVLERLLARRDVERVLSLDLRKPRLVSPKLEHVRADVRDPNLHQLLDGSDALVHLAFLIMHKVTKGVFEDINVNGSKNVFESAIRAGVGHIVYTSSIAAYGVVHGHPVPITETTPRVRQPEFPYSAAKYDVEEVLDGLEEEHPDLVVTRFRPSILIGTHMPHAMGQLMARGYVVSLGDTPAPLVWDEDVADAIVLALDKRLGGAFNVGTEEPLAGVDLAAAADLKSIRSPLWLLKMYGHLSGVIEAMGLLPSTDPSWFHVTDVEMIPSSEKARTELGWDPVCKTATDVVQHYQKHAPGKPDRRLRQFVRLANLSRYAKVSEGQREEFKRINLQIHLRIRGRGGGDVVLRARDARLTARLGLPAGPDAVLTMNPDTFADLVAGRQDVMSAQMMGRLKLAGEPAATALLGSLFANLQRNAKAGGLQGWAARRLVNAC